MSVVLFVASLYLPWIVFLGVVVTAVAQGGAGKQQVIVFKPQSFFRFDKNVRDVYPPEIELRALGESYIKRWIMPVLAQLDGVVIDGHCRLLGVKLVDPAFLVPTIITEAMLKPSEITQIQLISALQRNCLIAPDITKGIAQMRADDPALTCKEIGELLHFTDPCLVTRYESPYRCVPEVQQVYFEGKLGVSKAYEISKLESHLQLEALAMHLAGESRTEMKTRIGKKAAVNGTTPPENGTAKPKPRKPRKPTAPVIQIPAGAATISVRGLENPGLVEMASLLKALSDTALEAATEGHTLEAWLRKMSEEELIAGLPMAEEVEEECPTA